jgi:hypothetical protein
MRKASIYLAAAYVALAAAALLTVSGFCAIYQSAAGVELRKQRAEADFIGCVSSLDEKGHAVILSGLTNG